MVLTAIPVGFFAGLFGIGGGLISVPFLYYLFNSFGMDPNYVMHLAVGTSFSIIIPTSIVSVMTHHKFKAVDFDIVRSYGLFVVIGVIFGTIFAASIKTKPLVLFFSVVVFILAFYLLYLKEKETNPDWYSYIYFKNDLHFSSVGSKIYADKIFNESFYEFKN